MTSFTSLDLNPKILSALETKGYTTPTPIQLQAIPPVLEGKDILGIAQTGTGKTAAFSLPILHNLAKGNISVKSGCVRALILTPTRELASQIADNIEVYGKALGLRYTLIYGGVSDRPQITELQRGVDILIATPGRLLDLASQGHIRFMQVEALVLDEADRMLDMGFIGDIKKIIAKMTRKRQTLFFSATMPKTITSLADEILTNPVRIEVTPQSTTVDRIDQKIYMVERHDKPALLCNILRQKNATSVIVFSKTKRGADDIEDSLSRAGISVAAIHGGKDQDQREKSLIKFREGKIQALVATDIAARGIDIPEISHVINYDIPSDPESYVHRIGRTARAGRQGVAISFGDPHDDTLLLAVEKAINFKIPVDNDHGLGSKSSRSNKKPAPRTKREDKPHSRQVGKYAVKKGAPKSKTPSKTKKKAVIIDFILGLFKSKKPAAKKRNTQRPNVKGPEKRNPERRQPERKRSESGSNSGEKRTRPAPRTGKPIARTGGRKISSGKKD